ncbi:MAG: DUF4349 domain-containing protein [Spirosomataceae bacterium]
MKTYLLTVAFLFSLSACSQRSPESTTVGGDALPPVAETKMATPQEETAAVPTQDEPLLTPMVPQNRTQQKIIRNADLRFRVSDFKSSGEQIQAIVKRFSGLVMSSNETKYSGNIENNMVIRVPAAQFDALVDALLKESIFTDSKNSTAQDVTEEFIDAEARLKSKKAVEQRYLELLKQARNVEEIVKVEEQLRVLREEIEAKEGRIKYLNDQVAYSTVRLAYYQVTDVALSPEEPFYAKIWNNLAEGFRAMLSLTYGLFFFVPFVPVAYGLYWLVRRWVVKRRQKKVQNQA